MLYVFELYQKIYVCELLFLYLVFIYMCTYGHYVHVIMFVNMCVYVCMYVHLCQMITCGCQFLFRQVYAWIKFRLSCLMAISSTH